MQSRTHTCNELNKTNIGQKVVLVGWFDNIRKVSKNLAFLILRDFYGFTQIVIEDRVIMEQIDNINKESTLSITGIVRARTKMNEKLATGEIEIVPEAIEILGKCIYNALPFEIAHSLEADENARLKYRYLDLRNPIVKNKIVLRSEIITDIRNKMCNLGFTEISTPILTCSSPEGARDYLVPARNHPGKFYALPQAPQQFKQILMASGFDRYFQIAPCFRDEDARADRSPGEFYQLDMEMAFATQEDVFAIVENVIPQIFEKYGLYNKVVSTPFVRIPYRQAIERYGTDKPDLRINLEIQDISAVIRNSEFEPFDNQIIKAIVAKDFSLTRKEIENICKEVENETNSKVYWFRVDENGDFVGGVSKFLKKDKELITQRLNLNPGDFVGVSAGKYDAVWRIAGAYRRKLGYSSEKYINRNMYSFCWIVDFPMYEMGEESKKLEFCHNPFSMPQGGAKVLEEKDPLDILAYQYDLICNGVELSSGAVRNHDPEIMIKAFEKVGLGEREVMEKFPAMYNAFCYGAPPHAGIAPGIDRMIMLICGEESIREIIPFPMNKSAMDIMMGAPSEVSQNQLKDVHIEIKL